MSSRNAKLMAPRLSPITHGYSDRYPEEYTNGRSNFVETWRKPGMLFTLRLIKHEWEGPRSRGHFVGYVRFAKSPFKAFSGYNGIVTYVPVHGGVTYAERDADGSVVYGFDCNHYNDEGRIFTKPWLRKECEKMGYCILIAAKYDASYRRFSPKNWLGRSNVLVRMQKAMQRKYPDVAEAELSFGVMINLLTGTL
jgi:hypothetical protein